MNDKSKEQHNEQGKGQHDPQKHNQPAQTGRPTNPENPGGQHNQSNPQANAVNQPGSQQREAHGGQPGQHQKGRPDEQHNKTMKAGQGSPFENEKEPEKSKG